MSDDRHSPAEYLLSADDSLLQVAVIHRYLCDQSYWAKGIERDRVQKSIHHSLCGGAYLGSQQVGFARWVTDYATFAYLCDVFVLPSHQRAGLGKRLIEFMMAMPELEDVPKRLLGTKDAHAFYALAGWKCCENPERLMEIRRPLDA